MRLLAKTTLCLVAVVLCGVTAQAQPVAETCGPGDTLGPVTLPWTSSPAFDPASQDFTPVGCPALNGQDVVICFTPTTNCAADLTCSASGTVIIDSTLGACATNANCNTSASNSSGSVTLGVNLIGGSTSCAICSSNDANASFTFTIAAQVGNDCGSMPVSLQSFTAE